MPHDRTGQPLAVGDSVNVPCIVTGISPGPDYCNIEVQTAVPCLPGDYKAVLALNGRQIERRPDAAPVALAEPSDSPGATPAA